MVASGWSSWARGRRGHSGSTEGFRKEPPITSFLRNRGFGFALVAASLVALVLSGYSSYQTRNFSQCQSMVTEALIQASIARADAADEDRNSDRDESRATATLIQVVFTATSTEERIAAYQAYAKALEQIDQKRQQTAQERAQHPLPQPPSQVCA